MEQLWGKFKAWGVVMWRPILIFLAVALVVSCIFGFRLGSLPKAASQPEQAYISSITSGKELVKHPVYIVHKLPVYILFKLHTQSLAAYRAISALFAAAAVISCFFILREWYTNRVAILGTWLFLTSAWLLHIGRLATPEASYLLLMPLLWAAIWLYNTTLRKTALLLLTLLCAASFYIPGFGCLVLITAVWQHKRLWGEIKYVGWWFRLLCLGILLAGLVPLVWASTLSLNELLLAAGLPQHVPSLKMLLENFIRIPQYLLVRGPDNAIFWVGRFPLLEVFSSAMLFLGVYSTRFHLKLVRTQLLLASLVFFMALTALGGPLTITVLMPLVYVLIAAGLAFMLQQWFTVFPRNPLAHVLATTLMSVSVLLVSYYHINHYFIAWPQTPATKAAFSYTLIK